MQELAKQNLEKKRAIAAIERERSIVDRESRTQSLIMQRKIAVSMPWGCAPSVKNLF